MNRIALIGYGQWAKTILINNKKSIKFVFTKKSIVKKNFFISKFSSIKKKLKLFDIAHICTDLKNHFKYAKFFHKNNKKFIIEKPPFNSLREIKLFKELYEKKKINCVVNYTDLFDDGILYLTKFLKKKKIIKIKIFHSSPKKYYSNSGFITDWIDHSLSLIYNFCENISKFKILKYKKIIIKNQKYQFIKLKSKINGTDCEVNINNYFKKRKIEIFYSKNNYISYENDDILFGKLFFFNKKNKYSYRLIKKNTFTNLYNGVNKKLNFSLIEKLFKIKNLIINDLKNIKKKNISKKFNKKFISYYDFTDIHKPITKKIFHVTANIIKNNTYVSGEKGINDKFEKQFADYIGVKYCVALSSGTAALHVAAQAIGLKKNDEVITVAHTYKSTSAAIMYCGAKPVYVDIDPLNYVMDYKKIEEKITPKTKAILPVHIYGNYAPMEKITEIAKKYKISVIEDCAQATGTRYKDKHVGSFGQVGAFSFYPGKSLGAFGDAGAIVTNDEYLYEKSLKLRTLAYENILGTNYRMSTLNAEILSLKLKTLDQTLLQKKEIAEYYDSFFGYSENSPIIQKSYHIYPLVRKIDREKLIKNLAKQIEIKYHYRKPLNKIKIFKANVYLPITEFVSKYQISLPIYPGVNKEKVVDLILPKLKQIL